MDFNGLSSPQAPRSSLPPSSATFPTQSPNRRSTPVRRTADALTLGDDEAEEDEDANEGGRRRRRTRGQVNGDVPLVKDAVGESVAESFETFLKTCGLLLLPCDVF
jgi:DNA replication licensing factor MCM6